MKFLDFPIFEWVEKWSEKWSKKWSIFRVGNGLKPGETVAPDPYHGVPPGIAPCRHHHYPGYTHHCTTLAESSPCHCSTCLRGSDPFTRLHSDTVPNPKYRPVQNHHFLTVKKDLAKTALFCQKAYLILIVFPENDVFDVFDEKWSFSDLF